MWGRKRGRPELTDEDWLVRRWARLTAWRKFLPQPCEACGAPQTHMHHDDYNKPLEVRHLCHKHHVEAHKGLIIPHATPEAVEQALKHISLPPDKPTYNPNLKLSRPKLFSYGGI